MYYSITVIEWSVKQLVNVNRFEFSYMWPIEMCIRDRPTDKKKKLMIYLGMCNICIIKLTSTQICRCCYANFVIVMYPGTQKFIVHIKIKWNNGMEYRPYIQQAM